MPIVRIPYGNALLTNQNDYASINNLIATGFLQVNKPIWEDAANNIVQGAVFQIGGTVYYANATTAIVGVASNYIKLTPSGDGLTVAPTYVVDLTGVTWNSAYNGYYDVGGNAYVFDELLALFANEITTLNTKLWNAINNSNNVKLGDMNIVLTEYITTAIPEIGVGSWVEINGQLYSALDDITITGVTANSTWYDILLTPSGGTFTASFIARNTGAWSDSKLGLYSGNNRVVACVYRDGSANYINKNILEIDNRTCKIKIEIGDWDMVADGFVSPVHGLNRANIRSVNGEIRSDDLSGYFPIPNFGAVVPAFELYIYNFSATAFTIYRKTGGIFDAVLFNATSFNRGHVYTIYEV